MMGIVVAEDRKDAGTRKYHLRGEIISQMRGYLAGQIWRRGGCAGQIGQIRMGGKLDMVGV